MGSAFSYFVDMIIDNLMGKARAGFHICHLPPILRISVVVLVDSLPLILRNIVQPKTYCVKKQK